MAIFIRKKAKYVENIYAMNYAAFVQCSNSSSLIHNGNVETGLICTSPMPA